MIQDLEGGWWGTDFLLFADAGKPNPTAVTRVFKITNRNNGVSLGVIKWHPQWRRYSFYTEGLDTVFDPRCLRDILEFCEAKTLEQKSR